MQLPTTPFIGTSPQVRATVEQARAALEVGNLSEAADLFRSALAAGYNGADAVFLLGKTLTGLGHASDATRVLTQVVGDPIWGNQARGLLDRLADGHPADVGGTDRLDGDAAGAEPTLGKIAVAGTLPLAPGLPKAVVRVSREADSDITHGRYVSALDLTTYAITLAPGHLPLFVRHAELLVATGRPRDALAQAATIERLLQARGEPSATPELARVVAHADPSLGNLIALAQALLGGQDTEAIARYLPVAIAVALREQDLRVALDLACAWHQAVAHDPVARYVYVRELLRNGMLDDAVAVAAADSDLPQVMVAALAASVAAGALGQWQVVARLHRGIHADPAQYINVQALLQDIAGALPVPRALDLHRALIALAAGNDAAAARHLRDLPLGDLLSQFACAVCIARAAERSGDGSDVLERQRCAFRLVLQLDAEQRAVAAALFEPPATMAAVGQALGDRLATQDAWDEAVEVYRALVEEDPADAALNRRYAEALGRTGQRPAALERLRRLLAEQEMAGKHAAALDTLRTLVRIAPGNLSGRNKLIDALLKRGRVDEAVGELFVFAQLLERAHRVSDAVAQLRRAAEISSLISDWGKVDQIYGYMMQLQPEDIGLRHAAAATYLQSGQIRAALEQLQAVVRVSVTREDPDEAIAALHQIIALSPEDPEPYHRLGELLASVGEYGQAERVYRRLSTLLPDDPAVRAKQEALAALTRKMA